MTTMRSACFSLVWALCLTASCAAAESAIELKGPPVGSAINRALAGARGTYFYKGNKLVSDQLWAAFLAPPDVARLANGDYLFSGCRIHDCPEKGAVIISPGEAVVAVALVNFPCVFKRKVEGLTCVDYSEQPVLTVFVSNKNNRPEVVRALRDWADAAQLEVRKAYSKTPDIALTEIKIIPDRPSK